MASKNFQPRLSQHPPSLAEFRTLIAQETPAADYPLASTLSSSIPIYSGNDIRSSAATHAQYQDEWHRCLHTGPGVFIIQSFFPASAQTTLIPPVNQAYANIISQEAQQNNRKGDHFGTAGQNERIWNSFEKHAVEHPESFCEYYKNPLLELVAESWVGPGYRVTSQANVVKPGGKAQVCHRDYHLGFQTPETVAKYPLTQHIASQFLTLQGAVAHTAMPISSGPTKLLPYSQLFPQGYIAYHLPSFIAVFEETFVQAPLEAGDAVFFNPALFHAAGENKTENFHRSANLLQISAAWGKPMERVDTKKVILGCWGRMRAMEEAERAPLVKAVSEGYAFPVDLDRTPPREGGRAPESEVEFVERGLKEGWSLERLEEEFAKREGA